MSNAVPIIQVSFTVFRDVFQELGDVLLDLEKSLGFYGSVLDV